MGLRAVDMAVISKVVGTKVAVVSWVVGAAVTGVVLLLTMRDACVRVYTCPVGLPPGLPPPRPPQQMLAVSLGAGLEATHYRQPVVTDTRTSTASRTRPDTILRCIAKPAPGLKAVHERLLLSLVSLLLLSLLR